MHHRSVKEGMSNYKCCMIKQDTSSLQSWRSNTLDLVKLWAVLTDIPAVSPRQLCWQVAQIFLKCQQADFWLLWLCSPTKCNTQNRSGGAFQNWGMWCVLREFCCRENPSELAEEAVLVGRNSKDKKKCLYSDFYRESKEREILSNGLLRFSLLWLKNWREQLYPSQNLVPCRNTY